MNPVLSNTNLWTFCLWLLGRRKRFQVTGESMLPLLYPGEEILIDPYAYKKSPPQISDVVAVEHPDYKQLIIVKRVKAIAINGNCFLVGDNLIASTDSRHWGEIDSQKILGKVTNRFA